MSHDDLAPASGSSENTPASAALTPPAIPATSPPALTDEQKKVLEKQETAEQERKEAERKARLLAAAIRLQTVMNGSVDPPRLRSSRDKTKPMDVDTHFYPYKLEALPDEVDIVKELLANAAHEIGKSPDASGMQTIKLSPRAYTDLRGRLPRYIRTLGGAVPPSAEEGMER